MVSSYQTHLIFLFYPQGLPLYQTENRGPRDLRICLEVPVNSAVVNGEWSLPPEISEEAVTLQIVPSTVPPPHPDRGSDKFLWRMGLTIFFLSFPQKRLGITFVRQHLRFLGLT